MLPPSPMLTIKNWVRSQSALLLAATLLLAGCSPPGPRALLEGKRLLEQEKFSAAIPRLQTATTLLATNAPASDIAQAWNYLGVALQHTGQFPDAERAYQRAIALDHDLPEAHFNLGCLWLDLNRPEAARSEFTTYTLGCGIVPEGFVMLGMAELRAGESGSSPARARSLNSAESSFKQALKLNPQNVQALNGLGLVYAHLNKPADAAQCFTSALQQQPHFPPALLNLAILTQRSLRNPQLALQKYREYLALTPAPTNAEAVRQVVHQLEEEISPPAHPLAAPPPTASPANNSRTQASSAPAASRQAAPPVSVSSGSPPTKTVEAVTVKEEPALQPAHDVPAAPSTPPINSPGTASPPARTADASQPVKRSLFQRLFGSAQPAASRPASASSSPSPDSPGVPNALVKADELPVVPAPLGARYPYQPSGRPLAGNRDAAQRAFTRGLEAQSARHWSEAVKDYRAATQLDPSFFSAFYNLGLAAAQSKDLAIALRASEQAVVIEPESRDARYNFAYTLEQAGYWVDAANEFEKLLAYVPDDVAAHVALGNLYVQQFHQPARARPHYQRVLELAPHIKQADSIRFWLAANHQ